MSLREHLRALPEPSDRLGYLPVLAAQRADTETLLRDAERRGWGDEAARHHRLLERLDALMSQATG